MACSLLPTLGRDREGVKIDLGGKMGVNYGLNRVRFPGPVKVGKRIRVRTRLLNVEEISVRVISDTAALAHLVWSSSKRHGILTAVFAAPDWKIVSLQNTDTK